MILVTGASGTLGKEISKQLAQRKFNFRCFIKIDKPAAGILVMNPLKVDIPRRTQSSQR